MRRRPAWPIFAPRRQGQWIHDARMVVFREDTVFVHGGVSAEMASLGRTTLGEIQAKHVGVASHKAVFGSYGPMWYRGYLLSDEETACAEVKQALAKLEARRMVMGHTTQRDGKIRTRCDGAIVAIDTGISAYAGHNFSAFELIWRCTGNLPGQTVDLPDPKMAD